MNDMTSTEILPHLRRHVVVSPTKPRTMGSVRWQTDTLTIERLSGRCVAKWMSRPYILLFCFAPGLAILVGSLVLPMSMSTLLGQLALGVSTFASLWLLSDRPLINAIQALVFIFHWWFGVGPVMCAIFQTVAGNAARAEAYTQDHSGTLWVVAFGLPLYAACARMTIHQMSVTRWRAAFLEPVGLLYRSRTIGILAGIAAALQLALFILDRLGIRAYDTVNYLGGQITRSPLLAIVTEASHVSHFAVVAILAYLVVPRTRRHSRSVKIIAILVLGVVMASAVTSGSKGAIILPVVYLGILLLTWRQRLPWLMIVIGGAGYMTLIEPFVAASRMAAERASLTTESERKDLFATRLSEMRFDVPDWRQINIESPFRFIYPGCVEIASRSSFLSGPWGGQSLRAGLSSLVPRALSPDKADSNMGNFFAQQLNASDIHNSVNNIAITIPFEIVGNYGFLAGIGSFGIIGILWAGFISFLLTPSRLATHPLAPYFIGLLLSMESSVGQFLGIVKVVPIPLIVMLSLWLLVRRQL